MMKTRPDVDTEISICRGRICDSHVKGKHGLPRRRMGRLTGAQLCGLFGVCDRTGTGRPRWRSGPHILEHVW